MSGIIRHPACFPILALAANVALFAFQLQIMTLLSASQHGTSILLPSGKTMTADEFQRLPYPVFTRVGHPSEALHAAIMFVALAQTALLFGLWRNLKTTLNSPMVRVAVAVCVILMFTLGLSAKTLGSLDVYCYIGYAMLSFAHAYSPTTDTFPIDFSIVNKLWGTPLLPCVYGPLWLAVQKVATGWTNSVGEAVLASRVLGCVCVVGLTFALTRLKLPPVIYPLLLLNPAIITTYVVNAHNDVLGIVFIVLALAAVSSAPLVAAALVACGGLVKVSLIGLALVVFRAPLSLKQRIVYITTSIVMLSICSFFFGGKRYIATLMTEILQRKANGSHVHPQGVLLLVLEGLAVVILLISFQRGTILRAGSWPLFTLSGGNYPWYFIWGLPYAALSVASLIEFLIVLPLVSAMIDSVYGNLHYETLAMSAMILYVVFNIAHLLVECYRHRTTLGAIQIVTLINAPNAAAVVTAARE